MVNYILTRRSDILQPSQKRRFFQQQGKYHYVEGVVWLAIGHRQELCWKMDRAAQNGLKECIKGVSEAQSKIKLNYILVGRLCNLESL